jgi:glutaminyl-peptide cyclotransferase
VVPTGWVDAGSGFYVPGTDEFTGILQLLAPDTTTGELADSLLGQLGMAEMPEAYEIYESSAATWDFYKLEVEIDESTVFAVDLAMADSEGTAYVVLLQTSNELYDALHEEAFVPAVDAFAVLPLTWGQDDAEAVTDAPVPAFYSVEIIEEYPHDTSAFTQGLLMYEGEYYESTGRNGESTLRRVDFGTGEVLQSVDVPEEYFGEGLALVDDRLVQLTWTSGAAFVYDRESFELLDTLTYEGEGWGLCYDGEYLYRSDGSSIITAHDPETFEVAFRGLVMLGGQPVDQLNELECVDDSIYANVWQSDYILQIDKTNGHTVGLIDASGLMTEEELAELESAAVLNGIAYNSSNETFYLTGKLWPKTFAVSFIEEETTTEEEAPEEGPQEEDAGE